MVDRSTPECTKMAFFADVFCFWFQNCLHLNMRFRFNDTNWVIFSHSAGVDNVGIGSRFLASL